MRTAKSLIKAGSFPLSTVLPFGNRNHTLACLQMGRNKAISAGMLERKPMWMLALE
uniref:Uncharacterized protein n=1 Tax=Anguilla anguilla TaxID=7936 RepID=A0A0E9SBQ9_ANGAN